MNVVNIEKAVAVYHNPNYINDTVFYLFTNPNDVLRLVDQGVKISVINIGGMAFKQGKTQLTKAVSVDKNDINAFYALAERGVHLDLRVVTSDPDVDVIKKLRELESK
ncbi:Sorbose-specific phosphotransferase enzyme IIB component [Yersinia kristensenii ATCC 33638]|nr:Sorbose-specific phosphotransferase enzyme IIB component [Yersinia kristensenii ATCC 33638]